MNELADAQTKAGWNELATEALPSFSREHRVAYIEALLLKASLLRAQGQRQRSSALLQKILTKTDSLGEPRGFRLLFELGLDHWIDQDVANALEFFLLAERKARNPEESLFSLSNILWCLEALDLGRNEVEVKIENILQELGLSPNISHVVEQWSAYQLRKLFYTQMKAPAGEMVRGQPSFFSQWARSLPYMGGRNISLDLSQDYIWQGGYRTRTLAGIWVPSDRSAVRAGDAIDRLYLWTWLWMAKRPEVTQEKLFYTLESVLNEVDIETESKENILLLRNSLEWILLLEPSLSGRMQKTVASLRKIQSNHYPILETEYFLIQGLSPHSDSADLDLAVRRFQVFERILRETKSVKDQACVLPLLKERLSPFLQLQHSSESFALIVDCLREEVRIPSREYVLHSPGLVKLLASLAKTERVPIEYFVEPGSDLRSVHNFVARARKLMSAKSILLRKHEIVRGPDWPKILILHPESQKAANEISAIPGWSKRKNFVDSEVHLQAARALLPAIFDRLSLEKKMQVSKATACRMIEAWLAEKKISKLGKAKATSYSWVPLKELNL